MKWVAAARRHFEDRLRALGFECELPDGISLPWVKRTEERSSLMVEIEKERGFHRLHISLRRRGAREEVFWLAEAAGLRGYEYGSPSELDRALKQAREHFDAWGVPWLEGRSVQSPALAERDRVFRQDTHDRLIREGRVAFKRSAYEDAIASFAEASNFAPLDEVSAKMLGLALRKRET